MDALLHSDALLHTVDSAGQMLRCGRTTIYELMASGELESVTIGRARRIPHAALVEYVDRLREQARAA
ncbi:helix-turn-helix domain-containing protein [Phytohabitans sp. ZYX-F-186]|uniref:Helix-turn-helix domain-containing protein n=1 Tax=Phytohabitans maris TaxID=3071409 RepID=A0ABU0ZUN4_9ACTN|nr:helix-turn-helix domain-containing protein [Phytohabitans sp. ZYX-F-186]MDQ7910758.1 helix-turn-helix domain-containing protein [Phytohabitans sp. ZYX-F-186]